MAVLHHAVYMAVLHHAVYMAVAARALTLCMCRHVGHLQEDAALRCTALNTSAQLASFAAWLLVCVMRTKVHVFGDVVTKSQLQHLSPHIQLHVVRRQQARHCGFCAEQGLTTANV